MAYSSQLPAPELLDIHNATGAAPRGECKLGSTTHVRPAGAGRLESVQVFTPTDCDRCAGRRVFTTFEWNPATNAEKIQPVLDQFEACCRPRRNEPFK